MARNNSSSVDVREYSLKADQTNAMVKKVSQNARSTNSNISSKRSYKTSSTSSVRSSAVRSYGL